MTKKVKSKISMTNSFPIGGEKAKTHSGLGECLVFSGFLDDLYPSVEIQRIGCGQTDIHTNKRTQLQYHLTTQSFAHYWMGEGNNVILCNYEMFKYSIFINMNL